MDLTNEDFGLEEFDAYGVEVDLDRVECTESLFQFTKRAWHVVEPETQFVENWHIVELCKVLEGVAKGFYKRVIINVPPGTLKSLLVSVFFPAWLWARNPRKRVLTAAYGSHLTIRDNLRVRALVMSPWYQARFKVTMTEDQDTKTRYNTTAGGWRIATSVEGVGTGEHPDLVIIDDALTAGQAESDKERDRANKWFDRTISSRGVSRDVAVIVIGQRLHEEDLPGYLLKKDRAGWLHVNFPMRYEKCTCPGLAKREDHESDDEYVARMLAHVDALIEGERCVLHRYDPEWRPDPRDPRTQPGELLMPQIFTEAKVKQLEIDLGPFGAAGQLQQRPAPEGGGLFKMEFFDGKVVDDLPPMFMACRGCDTAGTDGDGDYTALVKIVEELAMRPNEKGRQVLTRTGRYFVAGIEHEQFGPDRVDDLVYETAEKDKKDPRCKAYALREEKEGGSSGKAVIQARASRLAPLGIDYEGVVVSGNKRTRAKPFRTQCAAGNVYLLRGSWNNKYLRELCGFPTATHDDLVDGSSTAFNGLVEMEMPVTGWVSW